MSYSSMAGTSHPGFNLRYDTADSVSEEWQAAVWPGKATGEHGATHHSQLQSWLSGEEEEKSHIFPFTICIWCIYICMYDIYDDVYIYVYDFEQQSMEKDVPPTTFTHT